MGPQVKEIVHDKDICNLVILTNRILNKALHTDMIDGESIGETTRRNEDDQHNRAMERVPGGSEQQSEHGGLEADLEWERGGFEAPLGSTSLCRLDSKGSQGTPRAGEATKSFIENASPDLGRLSRAMERCVHLIKRDALIR